MTLIGYVCSIKCSGGCHCCVVMINENLSILAPKKLVLLYSSPSVGWTSSKNLFKKNHGIKCYMEDLSVGGQSVCMV